MGAVLDLFNVLLEPTAVFQRVREKPTFLTPFLVIAVVQVIVAIVMLPYTLPVMEAAMAQAMAARGAPAGASPPNAGMFAYVGIIAQPIVLLLLLMLGTLVVWVMTSLFSGEAKFGVLLSVVTYASVMVMLQLIVTFLVLVVKGKENITTPADLQPPLGLDLLAPSTKGFIGALLRGINPFAVIGYGLTGIGVAVTHNLPRRTGYSIAAVSYLVMLLIGSSLAMLAPGSR